MAAFAFIYVYSVPKETSHRYQHAASLIATIDHLPTSADDRAV